MVNAGQLIETSKNYFIGHGYAEKGRPQGLINPEFPDTFNPCAGHAEISGLAGSPETDKPIKWLIVEPVYRHLDAHKVGVSNYHLSFFEMLTHVDSRQLEDSSKERTIEEILGLLNELGIDRKRLCVTVFDGYRLLGKDIPPDEESRAIWGKQLGKEKVFPMKSTKNIEYQLKEGEQAGPRRGDPLEAHAFLPPLQAGRLGRAGPVQDSVPAQLHRPDFLGRLGRGRPHLR